MSWYDNNENWYKPNYSQPAPVQSAVQRPQAKLPGNRRTRIIALILCAVLLLGGIVYSVLEADWSDSGTDEDGMPKSYMTYFEDYYASASKTPSSIKLEKVADRGSLTLQTGSSGAAKLSYNEIFQKCSPCVVGIKSFDGKTATRTAGAAASSSPLTATFSRTRMSLTKASVRPCSFTTARPLTLSSSPPTRRAMLRY